MARFRMTAMAFALVLVAAFAVAEAWRPVAPSGGDVLDVTLASSLKAFDDCDQYLDTVRGEALKQVTPYGLGGGHMEFDGGAFDGGGVAVGGVTGARVMREEAALESSVADSAAGGMTGGMTGGGASAAAPPVPAKVGAVEVSGTNVQESGVDEPDVVKTDGRVLAAVARGRLQLIDLRDGGRNLAATLPLSNGWGHELLLHGDRLLVTANVDDAAVAGGEGRAERISMRIAVPHTPKLELTLLDVADPANPRTVGSVRLDGQLVSSRLVDGMVRVVMRSNPQPAMATPQPGAETGPTQMRQLEEDAIERNREIVETSDAADWLPAYSVRGPEGDTIQEAPLVQCDAIRHPEQFRGFGLLSVLAVSMTGDAAGGLTPTGTASVLGDGDTVYATPDRLYVAMNRWEHTPGPEPMREPMPVEPDGGIGDGAVPPDAVVSDDGTVTRIAPAPGVAPGVAPAPSPKNTVDIHEFDTSDPQRPVYTASGTVPGHLINQWALSAHDGHLRVATTDGQSGFPGQTMSSAVYVLRRDGARLTEVGRVEGLGKDERIYAVRYFGDYGFVVTFRQTDPLYALDLSDPAAPRVTGELKIPGYSTYLHPVGDEMLLGVGQDAEEETGRPLGVQVSLFDVSDLSAPRRVANFTGEPNSSTEVEHEHRAFLWWPGTRRAVLPYQHATWSETDQRDTGFFGALVLDVNGDVTEAGRLSHQDSANPDPWWGQIRRAMVVGDTLYTMSERGLLASGVTDLDARGFTEFDGPTPQQQHFDRGEPVPEPEPEPLSID